MGTVLVAQSEVWISAVNVECGVEMLVLVVNLAFVGIPLPVEAVVEWLLGLMTSLIDGIAASAVVVQMVREWLPALRSLQIVVTVVKAEAVAELQPV